MARRQHDDLYRTVRLLVTGIMISGVIALPIEAIAQSTPASATDPLASSLPQGDQSGPMLLTANELVYNHDSQRVYALGGVQIYYAGYRMVADRVEYDQKSGRLMAYGGIEVIDTAGNHVRAEKLDVTDDFANGFANAISVRTPDNVAIAGTKAERVDGNKMIIDQGVYTACIPCSEEDKKPPLWQIRAQRVIQDGVAHTVRLERPRFQLWGKTIAILPTVTVPDNTVKRKAGFLFPSLSSGSDLGVGLSIPYYLPISPSSDVTFTATGYTQQGLLMEAQYRQRYRNGWHVMHLAGISQADSGSFRAGSSDAENTNRGMIGSTAQFRINPRWVFGWDVMAQSDNNFSDTYNITGFDADTFDNQVYLEGLGKRSSFSIQGHFFDVQDADNQNASEKKQAIVVPVIDYDYIAPQPVKGGQLKITNNLTNITRRENDVSFSGDRDRFLGLKGTSTRLTSEVSWERTFTTDDGLQLTPLLAARADGYLLDVDQPDQINGGIYHYDGNFIDQNSAVRGMVTAGLEASYPMLITSGSSSHIFEPIAQIYVRPDEQYAGELPNEDAQSLVFDAASLFDRDKFSGYDRVEGGTRANIGFRYSGSFDSGLRLEGIFGQSYQLAGRNSFASDDLTGVGLYSGLESTRSDYVGSASVAVPDWGLTLTGGARFDEEDFALNRTDATIDFTSKYFDQALGFTRVGAQPGYAYDETNKELQSISKLKVFENWSVSGAFTWDLTDDTMTRRWFGLTYEDICTMFSIYYRQDWDEATNSRSNWSVGAQLTLRTLGDISLGSSSDGSLY